jgi:hypothetical protein
LFPCVFGAFLGKAISKTPSTKGHLRKQKQKATYQPATYFFGDVLRCSGLILESIFMVFLSSWCRCRESAKNRIQKSKEKNDGEKQISTFWQNVFDMDFPQKFFLVFLNSPC